MKGSHKGDGAKLFIVTDNVTKGNGHKLQLGRFGLARRTVKHWSRFILLFPQGGSEISILGAFQDLHR